jgi:hypothetical protein
MALAQLKRGFKLNIVIIHIELKSYVSNVLVFFFITRRCPRLHPDNVLKYCNQNIIINCF